ncbi:VOC family protein [Candidatus Palauibacter sp.]|uniref:VOC family protein n=1 Tax=Candidatus Palauibacter sp. TaxID=3101350 RepID=UPI003B01BF5C
MIGQRLPIRITERRGRRKIAAFRWRALAGAAFALPATASAALAQGAPATCEAPGSSLRLDHVPVAVGDLDALSRRLTDEFGFHVADGTRDETGIETAGIGFRDGTRLELKTVGDADARVGPVASEAGRYAELIADGGGGAYLALAGPGLDEVVALAADLEPDLAVIGEGGRARAAFPRDHPLNAVFFVDPDQARPDSPEAPRHANGARGLQAVWVMVEDPERLTRFLLAFGASDCGPSRHPEHLYGRAVGIRGGTVYVVDALLWLADPGSAPVVSLTVRGGPESVSDNIVLGNAGGLWIELRPPAEEGG